MSKANGKPSGALQRSRQQVKQMAKQQDLPKAGDTIYQMTIQHFIKGEWVAFNSGTTTRQFGTIAEARAFAVKMLAEERKPGFTGGGLLPNIPMAKARMRFRMLTIVTQEFID